MPPHLGSDVGTAVGEIVGNGVGGLVGERVGSAALSNRLSKFSATRLCYKEHYQELRVVPHKNIVSDHAPQRKP